MTSKAIRNGSEVEGGGSGRTGLIVRQAQATAGIRLVATLADALTTDPQALRETAAALDDKSWTSDFERGVAIGLRVLATEHEEDRWLTFAGEGRQWREGG